MQKVAWLVADYESELKIQMTDEIWRRNFGPPYRPVKLASGDPIFCKNSKVQFYYRK